MVFDVEGKGAKTSGACWRSSGIFFYFARSYRDIYGSACANA